MAGVFYFNKNLYSYFSKTALRVIQQTTQKWHRNHVYKLSLFSNWPLICHYAFPAFAVAFPALRGYYGVGILTNSETNHCIQIFLL